MTIPKQLNKNPSTDFYLVPTSSASTSENICNSIDSGYLVHPAGSTMTSSVIMSPTRVVIKSILRTVLQLLLKLWKWASSFLVLIFLAAWFYGGLLPYCLLVIGILSLTYNVSDHLLYQPDFPAESRIFVATPEQFGLPFEEIWLQTKDRVQLHAYLIKQPNISSRTLPTMLFFHGNAGNIGSRLENAQLLFHSLKCNLFLVEYRGYGRSEGSPSEHGLYLDAQTAFEYLDAREDIESNKIFLFGRSLGGAVAIDLASRCDFRDRIAGIVIENSFTSIPAIARHLFPVRVVRWLPRHFYKNKFESSRKVNAIVCPALFICGTMDELVPDFMMNELYNKCSSEAKRLLRFSGGHNDTWTCDKYTTKLRDFISEAMTAESRRGRFYSDNDNIV